MTKHYIENTDAIESTIAQTREVRWAFKEERLRMRITRKLDQLRKAKKLSQTDLAELSDTTQPMLSRFFSGDDDRSPTLETLVKIADALGKDIELDVIDAASIEAFDWGFDAPASPPTSEWAGGGSQYKNVERVPKAPAGKRVAWGTFQVERFPGRAIESLFVLDGGAKE